MSFISSSTIGEIITDADRASTPLTAARKVLIYDDSRQLTIPPRKNAITRLLLPLKNNTAITSGAAMHMNIFSM